MSNFVSFPDGASAGHIDKLVLTLVDESTDVGSITSLVASAIGSLDTTTAALFNADPLIDYRAQRPLMNFKDGKLVDMSRGGISLSHAKDVEGSAFLHLHGVEPDFQWDALLADILDVIERFGVTSTYSFTAVPAPTPHTRPTDMIVRTTGDSQDRPVLNADFWFPASFADYVEFHVAKLGVTHTNVAVRVPIYMSNNRYFAGALGALGMAASVSGLTFPIGDLERNASVEADSLSSMMDQNEDFAALVANFEHEYDNNKHHGFVTAPAQDLSVPTMEEISLATEQFLAGASAAEENDADSTFDPQGLMRRFARYESGIGAGRQSSNGDESAGGGNGNGSNGQRPDRPSRRGKHSA